MMPPKKSPRKRPGKRKRLPMTWKNKEARVAAILKTRRRPLSGGNQNHGSERDDCQHHRLYVEVKMRARQPVFTLWEECAQNVQAEAHVKKRRPLIVLFQKGAAEGLFVVHEQDLLCVASELLQAHFAEYLATRPDLRKFLSDASHSRICINATSSIAE